MKNILKSCKSSQPLWSVPCRGTKAKRASSPKEENAAARQINARINPKEYFFCFALIFFNKSRSCYVTSFKSAISTGCRCLARFYVLWCILSAGWGLKTKPALPFKMWTQGSSLGSTIQIHPTSSETHALEIRENALAPGICSSTWKGKSLLVFICGQASRTGGLEEQCNSFTELYNWSEVTGKQLIVSPMELLQSMAGFLTP